MEGTGREKILPEKERKTRKEGEKDEKYYLKEIRGKKQLKHTKDSS